MLAFEYCRPWFLTFLAYSQDMVQEECITHAERHTPRTRGVFKFQPAVQCRTMQSVVSFAVESQRTKTPVASAALWVLSRCQLGRRVGVAGDGGSSTACSIRVSSSTGRGSRSARLCTTRCGGRSRRNLPVVATQWPSSPLTPTAVA
jgi:hypothetical protein